MINADLSRLSRKQLMEHFEQERQEWLAAGMNEADIYRVHFGEETENGRGGEYRVWLNERTLSRADHKYAPGTPVAIDEVDPDGAWISGGRNGLDDAEFSIDLEAALSALTELQRYCFTEVFINGRTYREVAKERGKHFTTIAEAAKAAKSKLKIAFT